MAIEDIMIPNPVNSVPVGISPDQTKTPGIGWKRGIALLLPLPLCCFFLIRALSMGGEPKPDPQSLASLTSGLLQALYFIGALGCLYLSLRTYFRVKTSRK